MFLSIELFFYNKWKWYFVANNKKFFRLYFIYFFSLAKKSSFLNIQEIELLKLTSNYDQDIFFILRLVKANITEKNQQRFL